MHGTQHRLMLRRVATSPILIATLVLAVLIGSWLGSQFWCIRTDWPFVQAAGAGDIGKVRAGLDSGIDINRANEKGATALDFALASGRPNKLGMVRFLLDHGADPGSGLFLAVEEDRPDLVRLLIAHGANVNARDHDGSSLIAEAAQRGRDKNAHEIIQMLRAAGEVKPGK